MHRRMSMRHLTGLILLIVRMLIPHGVEHGWAQDRDAELEALKQQVEELRRQEARAVRSRRQVRSHLRQVEHCRDSG